MTETTHDLAWRELGNCVGVDPDLFFGGRGDNKSHAAAKAVCAGVRCGTSAWPTRSTTTSGSVCGAGCLSVSGVRCVGRCDGDSRPLHRRGDVSGGVGRGGVTLRNICPHC